MGLDNFKTPKSNWMRELENRAENSDFSLTYSHTAANSHHFKIEGTKTTAIGKTHHTRESNRDKSYISLNSVEEANWIDNPMNTPLTVEENFEVVDVFGIVIDHQSSGKYQSDLDDFLVLPDDILDDIPKSGKKAFRITPADYRHPFGKYVNSWERIFENL